MYALFSGSGLFVMVSFGLFNKATSLAIWDSMGNFTGEAITGLGAREITYGNTRTLFGLHHSITFTSIALTAMSWMS